MMFARVATRVLPLAVALATGGALVAQAQTAPWPTAAPQQPASNTAPWPSAQPAAPMAMPAPSMGPGPGGPGMMMGGPGPSPEQQKCMQQFAGYRGEVEKRAKTAEAESKKRPTREKMCELVSLYSTAELKWIKFSEANMVKCGIPPQALEQIKTVHTHTLDAKKRICSPGPTQAAAPAAPSLSDALSGSLQPTADEEKKHKAGGTMDTLTGNVLTTR